MKLKITGLFVAIAASCFAGNMDSAKPNVVVIYYDDMGYGDMGVNFPSNPKSLTPNLDGFAEGALRFTNGHSSDGVCSPSRYSLMTGHYSWRTSLKKGVIGGYSETFMDADRFTIGKMFQKQGYETAMVGKWHIGMSFQSPAGKSVDLGNNSKVLKANKIDFSKAVTATPYHRAGFDYYFGTAASLDMPPYVWLESKDGEVHALYKGGIVKDDTVDFSQARIAKNSDLAEGQRFGRPGVNDPTFIFADYLQVQAAKVSDIMAKRDQDGKPFFLYVPMPAPHAPHTVQKKFEGSAGWTYGDYIVQTDHYTGEILNALGDPKDPTSLAANTVVFITSDNGPEKNAFKRSIKDGHDANGPWAGIKRDSYEGGTRVPFMVRWPGAVTPGVTDHACWQGDFLATMAEYIGHELAADEAPDAESFLPVLEGRPMPKKRRAGFIQHSAAGQFAVVDYTGEWKLIDGSGGGGNKETWDADNEITLVQGEIRSTSRQLFNLKKDPGERVNLLSDPSSEARAKEQELYELLNRIRGDKEWGVEGSSNVPR
ncbi:sulfatase family protein [Pontiella sulfatireligans]|uniref:Arylsulfatase n=1 Tax=Pontiella sulfatireligans TaxID=2750658 RepID=A0A6C2UG09_9BACT|nr:arylsulfatase [Pontiella sulfatireligans]SPS74288.1 sulfatase S1_15 [Kiritimatiellales bacterium]VGO19095.1 Arylsulfatase [Pontiella sulfatireligans]